MKKKPAVCSGCEGLGRVCCQTWVYAYINSTPSLEVNELTIPLWPSIPDLELVFCPFCGRRFEKTNQSID